MPTIDPFHAEVARIALGVAERYGFALGGGLALVTHGVVERPTDDADLFSDREGSVPPAAQLVQEALEAAGIEVEMARGESELGVRLDRMPDWEFNNYGLDADAVAELRRRIQAWPRP